MDWFPLHTHETNTTFPQTHAPDTNEAETLRRIHRQNDTPDGARYRHRDRNAVSEWSE